MWRVIADYHTHTKYSHGTGTILDNAREAKARGLEVLGIADHGPANWGHIATTGLEAFDQIIAETRRVEAEISGLKILAGTEANLISYDGELDIPLSMQRKLDQVLAGFHVTVKPKQLRDGVKFATDWTLGRLSPSLHRKARADNTKAMTAAIYNNEIDIITHPGLNISIDTVELARACVKRDTALEINAKHGVKSIAFIQAAAREGARFAIGSDAHQPDQVGRLGAGVAAARQAGLRPDQIMNVIETDSN
jgi:putative hydrolase